MAPCLVNMSIMYVFSVFRFASSLSHYVSLIQLFLIPLLPSVYSVVCLSLHVVTPSHIAVYSPLFLMVFVFSSLLPSSLSLFLVPCSQLCLNVRFCFHVFSLERFVTANKNCFFQLCLLCSESCVWVQFLPAAQYLMTSIVYT